MLLYKIARTCVVLNQQIQLQKKYNASFLIPFLKDLELEFGETFEAALAKKIVHGYALFPPALLFHSFCRMNNKPFDDEERKRAAIICIISPLYDDFFDNETLSPDDIKRLTLQPQGFEPNTFEERVFKKLHLWLLENIENPEVYMEVSEKLFEAQLQSKEQTNPSISNEAIYTIGNNKGYYSLLIFHHLLKTQPSEAFKKALYLCGGLIQLGNDAFDVYKDLQDGIYTLPNRKKNVKLAAQIYKRDVADFNRQMNALDLPQSGKDFFKLVANLIFSCGRVALHQLEKTAAELTNGQDFDTVERKKLICDMDKQKNRLLWLKYYYQFASLQ